MRKFLELAAYFYGVRIPLFKRKKYLQLVMNNLNERYSIETAIGMAIQRLHIGNF